MRTMRRQHIRRVRSGNVLVREHPVNYSGFFIGANAARVGGYSTRQKTNTGEMKGMADFVDHDDIIKMAAKNKQSVHLAGNWSFAGRKGYGETVSPSEARRLSNIAGSHFVR